MTRRTWAVGVGLGIAVLVVAVAAVPVDTLPAGALRTVTVGAFPTALAVDARTGHLFVVNNGHVDQPGSVSMLDVATGRLLRTVTVGSDPTALIVDARHGHVFVTNLGSATTGMLDVLDARSAGVVATIRPPTRGAISAALDGVAGRLVVTVTSRRGPGGSSVSIFDTASLRRLIVVNAGLTPIAALAVDERTHHAFVLTLGTLTRQGYVGGGAVALDDVTGRVLRRVRLPGSPVALTVDGARGRAFALSYTRRGTALSLLATRSGRLLRTLYVGALDGPMILAERTGRLFIAGGNRVVMCDAHTGRVLRTIAVPHAVTALAVSARAQRVYLVHGDANSVSVLDARTGALTRTFHVVQDPVAAAADDRDNRLFVASSDVSAGPDSGMHGTNRLTNVVTSLFSALHSVRKGETGSVTTFNLSSIR